MVYYSFSLHCLLLLFFNTKLHSGVDKERKKRNYKETTNRHTHSTKQQKRQLVASNQFELSLLLNLEVTALVANSFFYLISQYSYFSVAFVASRLFHRKRRRIQNVLEQEVF